MAKEKRQIEKKDPEAICPIVDKYQIVTKLRSMIDESGDIAEYIDENVHYGRALGYAEGRHAAYNEIANRIIEGDFDPYLEEDCDGYEM